MLENLEKGGKWGKGKGMNGQGKGYYGGTGQTGYRSPGKVIGKGINYWGEDDYTAAWGSEFENQYNYEYDDWNYGYGEAHYLEDQMMRLEHGNSNTTTEITNDNDNDNHTTTTKQLNAVSGKRDPLKGIESAKAVITHNKYIALTNEDDNDSDDDNDNDSEIEDKWTLVDYKTHSLNKRQRAKRRTIKQQKSNDDCYDGDEAIRDAAAMDRMSESAWIGMNTKEQCEYNPNKNTRQRRRQVHFNTTHNDIQIDTTSLQSHHNGTTMRSHNHCIHKASSPMPHATTISIALSHLLVMGK